MPPPIARTMYALGDADWRTVAPVVKAVAIFGMNRIDDADVARKPLTGFIAGLIAGFDPIAAADVEASYRVEIDERLFDFSVDRG
jgi:hypothetical protein